MKLTTAATGGSGSSRTRPECQLWHAAVVADGHSQENLQKRIGSVHGMSKTKASPETEREGLCEFLDMQREALIDKVQGLSDDQARMAATSSSLSLLSLIKHSAIWDRRWFQVIVAGRSFPGEWPEVKSEGVDPTFRLTEEDTVETVVADYREQIAASQEIVGRLDLETPCAWPEMASQNLRWVALHMIEETARHAGHADIIRETIDGSRGP
jgi:uncharacterized damage-inducible protein DinB